MSAFIKDLWWWYVAASIAFMELRMASRAAVPQSRIINVRRVFIYTALLCQQLTYKSYYGLT